MKWLDAQQTVGCKCLTADATKCFHWRDIDGIDCYCYCHSYETETAESLTETLRIANMSSEEVDELLRSYGVDPDELLNGTIHYLNNKLITETDEVKAETLRGLIRELSNEL